MLFHRVSILYTIIYIIHIIYITIPVTSCNISRDLSGLSVLAIHLHRYPGLARKLSPRVAIMSRAAEQRRAEIQRNSELGTRALGIDLSSPCNAESSRNSRKAFRSNRPLHARPHQRARA